MSLRPESYDGILFQGDRIRILVMVRFEIRFVITSAQMNDVRM
jgi:hypothetical protein